LDSGYPGVEGFFDFGHLFIIQRQEGRSIQ